MEWTYEIMHLDVVAARFSSDGTCRISAASFLPWNLYLEEDPGEDLSIRINNLTNFYYSLNRFGEIRREWFEDQATEEMFFRRLRELKKKETDYEKLLCILL